MSRPVPSGNARPVAGQRRQCRRCRLPITWSGLAWTVAGTGTTGDGLSFCPPDPDAVKVGDHKPAVRIKPLFEFGRLGCLEGAAELMAAYGESEGVGVDLVVLGLLDRHISGDWGDVDEHDAQANWRALVDEARVFSVYHLFDADRRVYVITEADRSATTFMLPGEY